MLAYANDLQVERGQKVVARSVHLKLFYLLPEKFNKMNKLKKNINN